MIAVARQSITIDEMFWPTYAAHYANMIDTVVKKYFNQIFLQAMTVFREGYFTNDSAPQGSPIFIKNALTSERFNQCGRGIQPNASASLTEQKQYWRAWFGNILDFAHFIFHG